MSEQEFDAIVIGGGPAGSTASAILAQHGRRVVLVEKERFPRYHIGESLMPFTWYPLQRLGLLERMKQSHFPRKYSVQFVRTSGNVSTPFYFYQHRDHPSSITWQVVRSEFDLMLLDNARERGVDVREQTPVREVLRDERGAVVGVRAGETELRAPITIDASGREAVTMSRSGWRIMDEKLRKIALWTYWKGALRDPGLDEGATTVAYLPEKGWFWYIPLPDDVVSVGIVAEKDYLYNGDGVREPRAIFEREVRQNAWIEKHLARGARCDDFRATSEWTYRSRHCASDGVVLVGDAFGFLDPIFSSGVLLALKSGELAADAAHAALGAGDTSAARFESYGALMNRGVESMRQLVYAFYDHQFSFRALMDKHPQTKGRITDCLMGDVFTGGFTDLFEAVREFAALPAPIEHGAPRPP